MENEEKRAKRGIIIAFSVLVCILLVIAVIFFMYRSQHTFSQEKWLSNASERYMIVDDMLEKHLEQKGLVLRRTDEHDERRVNVSLTDAGRKLINERRREAIERVAAALRSLGEEDALEYIRLQQKMLDALSASDKQA